MHGGPPSQRWQQPPSRSLPFSAAPHASFRLLRCMRRALKARERLSFPFRANPVFLESVGFSFELCQLRQVDFPLVFITLLSTRSTPRPISIQGTFTQYAVGIGESNMNSPTPSQYHGLTQKERSTREGKMKISLAQLKEIIRERKAPVDGRSPLSLHGPEGMSSLTGSLTEHMPLTRDGMTSFWSGRSALAEELKKTDHTFTVSASVPSETLTRRNHSRCPPIEFKPFKTYLDVALSQLHIEDWVIDPSDDTALKRLQIGDGLIWSSDAVLPKSCTPCLVLSDDTRGPPITVESLQ